MKILDRVADMKLRREEILRWEQQAIGRDDLGLAGLWLSLANDLQRRVDAFDEAIELAEAVVALQAENKALNDHIGRHIIRLDTQEERIETLEQDNGKLRERLAALEQNGTIDRAAALQNWERIDTLERRADEVDALNHSRAQVINDACDRIERLEKARLPSSCPNCCGKGRLAVQMAGGKITEWEVCEVCGGSGRVLP